MFLCLYSRYCRGTGLVVTENVSLLFLFNWLFCTAKLVQLTVARAVQPTESTTADGSDEDSSTQDGNDIMADQTTKLKDGGQTNRRHPSAICQQIDQCLAFFVGVPDSFERSLQALLRALYDEDGVMSRISFLEIHGVDTIFDVVRLFPG
ncbi:unnamed protein product [Phytophthora fragariaefolia]|uniref:Unnamed protein product n=1 Tax=Phytophthora fragariaefolia TaxID=1490495 RepID=A0A9W6U0A7_9STRA|nr:unnamed protein product [Phytophthora fragariaefolia]